MRWLVLSALSLCMIGLLALLWGCAAPPEVPVVPPPPEDLSTWTVPELIQPLPPAPDASMQALDVKPTAAEKVYAYTPGTPYQVQVAVGWPLDVVLEPGEQVRNIVGGERSPSEAVTPSRGTASAPEAPPVEAPVARRWEVREGASGQGESLRAHLFLSASDAGMQTGIVATTTRRTYLLDLKSVKSSPIRVLRWTYGASTPAPLPKTREASILPDPQLPARYHVGYQIASQGRVPDWLPREVVDDGKKLYLLYPEVTLFGVVPVLRMLGPNGPQIVNSRQYLHVVIVDQLPARLELRVGIGESAEVVTVTRGSLRTIECPGDADCPHWPAAAMTLDKSVP